MLTTLITNCWDEIGVGGDRSCGELKAAIHCRNCAVYAAAGRGLLDREMPPGYLDEGLEAEVNGAGGLAITPTATVAPLSVMVVRLGEEWLAIPVHVLQEVTPVSVIHTLPHRTNELLLGLVNVRGEILLCIALKHLLHLDREVAQASTQATEKLLVLAQDRDRWVIAVDEIGGFHRCHPDEVKAPPTVVTKSAQGYTQGVMTWQNRPVNYLDVELLFYTLNRRIF